MNGLHLRLWNLSPAARWAPFLLRLLVGYGFMSHGIAKLMKGPDAFAAILHGLGMPAPHLLAWLTILTELFGGLAVFFGAFVPFASVALAMVLLVAIATVHFRYGFSSIRLVSVTPAGPQFGPVGYETNLLYLAALFSISAQTPISDKCSLNPAIPSSREP